MQATLAELAALVGGETFGDDQLAIAGAAVIRDAEPGQITLVDQAEKGRLLENCRASAVVAPPITSLAPRSVIILRYSSTACWALDWVSAHTTSRSAGTWSRSLASEIANRKPLSMDSP